MTRLSLTLLGDFQARLGPGPPLRLRTRKTEALLAYLASPPGRSHSRDKLAALLWGDRSPHRARSRLRETVFMLRRALASADPPCLQLGSQTLALDANAVDVDVVTFERLEQAGDPEALARAADLYRGNLLEGLAFRGALFEEWLMAERERLRELALDALAKLLARQRAAGWAEAALRTALRLIALDPLQESLHRTLMRLYAELNRAGPALRQYQLCVALLQRELGVEPEPGTRQLYQEILRQRLRPGGGAIPETAEHAPFLASPTPLIGRSGEMTWLRQALAQARSGAGQLALIAGEAGVGKTRLTTEIATEAPLLDAQFRLLLGRCHESDQILPFGPWVDAFRTSGVTSDGALLDELPAPWRAELARLLPEMEVPGLPAPGDNRLLLFESVTRLLERLAVRQPVLIVLEDVHWADEMTLRLLAFVTRRIHPWRLLLLATCREEDLADAVAARRLLDELGGHSWVTRMTLAPLPRTDTIDLIRSVARARSDVEGLEQLEERVWALSEGNPFVVVEAMRARQAGPIPPEPTGLPLPERVRAMIAARLERLSEPARQLASMAAVIGREFEFPLLHHASGLDEGSAAEGVEELVRRRVLQGVGDGFDFVHHRLQTVVYDRLLPHRRKLLHRRAGEALEALSSRSRERDPLAMGLHFREGEVWEKVVSHMWHAGTQAASRSAYRQAVACIEEALAALGHLPETRERLAQAVDLHLEARWALYPLREMEAMFAHVQAAEAAAVTLGDQRRLAAVFASLTNYFSEVGELDRGLETGQHAVALGDALADFGLRVAANQYLGQIYMDRGAYRDAKAVFSRHAAELAGHRVRERFGMTGYPSVHYRYLLGYCHAELGEFVGGVRLGQDALRIAEEIDQPYACSLAHVWLGRIHLVQGEFAQASREIKTALDIAEARQLGLPLLAVLGYARVMSGEISGGLEMLETGVASLRETKWFGRLALVSAWLGEAYMMAGRLVEGSDTAHRALALARQKHQRGFEALTLRLLGEIEMHGSRPAAADAQESYRQALVLAEELGMRPLAARCHLGLGRLHQQATNRLAVQEELATARSMLEEMGMRFWLVQAEAAQREL